MSLFNDNKELMRQIILSHYDKPNNKVDNGDNLLNDGFVMYHNKSSSCIDDITIYIKYDNDKICDAKFSGIGCAISSASTDILCDLIIDKTEVEFKAILDSYYSLIKNEEIDEDSIGELIAFKEIYKQPGRIKCSLIGADAFIEIMKRDSNE
ncbi:MAG: Fe-S cluster assembly sulfur transfer protein SufU [Mycoplasma sp.]